MAATAGISRSRVDEVLDRVGLSGQARQAAGSLSLGMGQRFGLASTLLADPAALILDEPDNGLGLDGIRWIRGLLTELAAEGRTVFLSSHLMSEMSLVAQHVIVIRHGRILRDQPMAQLIAESASHRVRVRTPDASRLAAALAGEDVTIRRMDDTVLEVKGVSSEEVGTRAAREGVVLYELSVQGASLEDAYLALTEDEVEHRGGRSSSGEHDDTAEPKEPHRPRTGHTTGKETQHERDDQRPPQCPAEGRPSWGDPSPADCGRRCAHTESRQQSVPKAAGPVREHHRSRDVDLALWATTLTTTCTATSTMSRRH